MTRPLAGFLAAVTLAAASLAQPSSHSPLAPPANGPRRADPTWIALVDATVHPRPGETLEHATVILKDGRITAVLPADGVRPARLPLGPRVVDCKNLHLYAAFIEGYAEIDAPAPKNAGTHWSQNVLPQRSPLDGIENLVKAAEPLRKAGFGAAAIAPKGGVFRGTAAVVSLAKPSEDPSADKPPVYLDLAYHSLAFETRSEGYPDSQMGAIALMRQTLLDADWQTNARSSGAFTEPPNALDALAMSPKDPRAKPAASLPLLFDCTDELEVLRAAKVATEFSRPYLILGSGSEYKRLAAITPLSPSIFVPVNFPKPPDASSVGKAEALDLRELMAWEQAPTNARRLGAAGVTFAFTSHRLKDKDDLLKNVRSAVKHGLAPDAALAALTTTPAKILGVAHELGTIEAGKRANLLLTDGPVFASTNKKDAKLLALFIDGTHHELAALPPPDLEGTWEVTIAHAPPAKRTLVFDAENALTVTRDGTSVKGEKVDILGSRLAFTFDHEKLQDGTGIYTISALIELDDQGRPNRLEGQGLRHTGEAFDFSASRLPPLAITGEWRVVEFDSKPTDKKDPKAPVIAISRDRVEVTTEGKSAKAKDVSVSDTAASYTYTAGDSTFKDTLTLEGERLVGTSTLPDTTVHKLVCARTEPKGDDEDDDADITSIPESLGLPFGPYAFAEPPAQKTLLLTNATVWTQSPDATLVNASILVRGGVIEGVFKPGASLPSGLETLDCTGKHITPGIIDCHSHTGISKGTNEAGQAVSSEVRVQDVTDPDDIDWYRQLAGGVTCVNNLHGSANAIGGQSQTNKLRWGCVHPDAMHFEGAMPGIKFALGENPRQANRDRPTSRYPQTRMGVEMLIRDRFAAAKEYTASMAKGPVRRDLELEPLAEILAGTRLLHCHSYRQDEIVMLANVAKEHNFRIGTYQHILEGYKVADYVRDYSGGGSAFADWWAYKVEVQDAIPQGPPLMHEVGAVVSYNSDSDELARRLNVDAAKAVKYGGLTEVEALSFVTLNPAKQLRVDQFVGSLEPGKHADLVIWSGHPLSAFSKAEATYIDGRCYFSLAQDKLHRERHASDRQRILQKLLKSAKKRKDDKKPASDKAGPEKAGDEKPTDNSEENALLRRWYIDEYNKGRDPTRHVQGRCGCGMLHRAE